MKSYPTVLLPLIRDRIGPVGPTDSFHGLKSTDRAAREEILHRAYLLWENEGRPENRALAHWLRAEVEMIHSG